MKREDLELAISFFAEKYGAYRAFEALGVNSIPERLKMIVLLMFENEFSYYSCTHWEYTHYQTILSAHNAYKNTGYLDFKE